MKSFLRGFFSVVLLLVCASCASSKRMTRISPFGEMPRQAQLDRDRINAWPLVYHQRDTTSLLWPIVDIDDRGFAIRPLLNVEDQVWSVLFPLSSYSFDRKVGWFLTAYKYEDYLGVFPLFHKGDDIDSIGPFWRESKDAYGIFPVAGKFSDLVHIGPVWWEGDGWGLEQGGVFPVIYAGAEFVAFNGIKGTLQQSPENGRLDVAPVALGCFHQQQQLITSQG